MIATLTLNPAVDKTIRVPRLAIGAIQRPRESHLDPGGKGINVSRMADRLGWPTIAFGILAGQVGEIIAQTLDREGVQSYFVQVPGQTRLNVTLFDESTGRGTGFYDPGPPVGASSLRRLEKDVAPWLKVCPVVALAGSLPPDAEPTTYARYIRRARAAGARTILDTSGEPLRLGVESRPYLIKPNVAELEGLLERRLPDLAAIVEGAREIAATGVEIVVVSMGARGAVCVEGESVWLAIPPRVERRTTIGSGDSMVAGLAVAMARGESVVEGLRLGTAAGAATAMVPGTELGSAATVLRLLPEVRIERLEQVQPPSTDRSVSRASRDADRQRAGRADG